MKSSGKMLLTICRSNHFGPGPALLGVVLLALAGPALAALTLSPNTANIAAGGGGGSVQVIITPDGQATADQSWTANSDQPWLTITSGSSGKGNGSVTYSVAGNPAAASRTANLTVTSSTTAVLVVTQLGGILSISPSSANADPAGSGGTITVSTQDSSLQWTATRGDSWATITSGGSGIGPGSIQWTAGANTLSSSRTAVITVTPLSGVGQTFSITQPGGAAAPSISVSPSSISVDAPGGSGAIQVTASISSLTWSASTTNADLVHLTTSSGTGSGAIQYTITANPSAVQRTATITVTPGQGAPAVTVSVTQSGGTLSISPASATVPGSGSSGAITLTTNDPVLKWTVSVDQSWVTITSGSQGTGPGQIQWTGAANTSNSSRSATISITPQGGTPQLFYINQAAGTITGTITLSPGSANVPASTSNGTVQVTSSDQLLTWTAASSASWLTITSGASGTGNGSIQYSALGNPTAATQTATITVTPANQTPVLSTVTQAGAALTISSSSASIAGSAATGSFSISTNNATLQWSATSNAPWLTITSATSGIADATMTWAAAANTSTTPRTATISITPQGGSVLTFTVSQAGLNGTITTSPATLSFSYQQLGSVPAASQVTVNGPSGSLPFTVAATGGNWLSVSSNGSTTPAVINVSVSPTGLGAGTYQGAVTITSPAATNSPVSVPVTFTITPAPVLTSAPNALSFSYQQNGSVPGSQTVSIGTSGSPVDYTIVADPTAPWLSATGAGPAPATVTVNVNTAGLQPGSYQGTITFIAPDSGNSPFALPVSLMVSAAPALIASPSSLSVTYRQLDLLPAPINFTVTSSGAVLPFSATVSSSTPWLTLTGIAQFSNTGQTPATIQLAMDPTGLVPGTYQGSIIVSSLTAGNNPLTVPVTLTVTSGAVLSAAPAQVGFGWTQNASTTAMQSFAVSSSSPLSFAATVQTSSGGTWLNAMVSAAQTPAVVTVSGVGTGLAPGVYNGTVTLTSAQATNSPLVIPVTLAVSAQPQLQISSGALNFSYQLLSGSSPPQQSLTSSTPDQSNAPVSAAASTSSGGSWLSVSGGATAPGAIQVSADPTGLTAGTYAGTITLTAPGYAPAMVTVTFKVTSAAVFSVQPASFDFAVQQGSAGLLPQAITVSSSSTAFPFSASVGLGTSWLSVTGGGTTPASVSVSANPSGLAPGSYSGTVVLTGAQAGNSPLLIPVHLEVTAGITVASQPSSLNFTYTQQGTVPSAQPLSISSPQALNLSTSISPEESWLLVTGNGPTPAGLQVSVDPNGLTPGKYAASIIVSATGAANTLVVPVSLTVLAAPSLTASQGQFTFSYQVGGMTPANQILTVMSTEPSLVATADASTVSGGNWLTVMGGGNVPVTFSIMANPSGLPPGTYQGSVVLSAQGAGNSPVTIPVTMVVAAAPVISTAPSQLAFSYTLGSAVPAGTPVQVTSSGGALPFQASATTDVGGPWLQVATGGTTPATVMVSVSPMGLSPGTYTGTVAWSSTGAGNTPLLLPVTLMVSTTTTLTAAPASVQFVSQQGGTAPASQALHLDSGGTPIAVTYQGSPGASWLSYSGGPTTPTDVIIAASPAGLAPGRYTAVVLVVSSFAANSPLEIPVTFDVNVTPVLSVFPPVLQYSFDTSGPKPVPQSVSVFSSGGPLQFSISGAALPTWLFASGTGSTPGTISVSVDPGALTAGVYQGTVQVSSPGSTLPVSVQAVLTVSNAPVLTPQPSAVTFAYQLGASVPAAASVVVSSDRGMQTIVASPTTFSGGNWLIVSGGGDTPATTSVSINPASLAPGVYQGQVSFMASGVANSPLVIPVTLTVSSAPTLNASLGNLSFAYQIGGSARPNQQITVTASDGSALPVTATVSGGGGSLTVTQDLKTTPVTLTVAVSTGNLSAGVYQASIVLSSTTAGNSPLVIPVVLTISAAPSLTASPGSVVFASGGGVAPLPFVISLNSTGTPLNFSASVAGGSPWILISGTGTTPATIQLAANAAGLSPGTYSDTVVITSPGTANNPLLIPVSLVVSSAPLLLSSPVSLSFSQSSTALRATQTLQIASTGTALTFGSSISSSTPWLVVQGSGATPQSVTVSVDATGLAPGNYQGAVQIFSTGTPNSPLNIPVTLQVNETASLQASPSPVSFSYKQAGPVPPSQSIGVTLGGQPALNARSGSAPGAPWLSVLSGAGGTVTISANPAELLPGTYTGVVLVIADGAANSPLTVPVSLIVAGLPEFDISQDSVAFTVLAAQSQPISNTISVTTGQNPPVDFELDVTASTWLMVTPSSGITPATLTVTADPTGLRPGSYSGSVIVSSGGKRIRTIPVNLTVAAAPTLTASPPFLVFSYSHGGNVPSPVNLYIGRFGTDVAVIATPSDPWISVNPSTPSSSGPITVSVSPAGLAAGVYHGSVTLAVADGSGTALPPKTIPVTLYIDQPADPQIESVLNGMSFFDSPLAPGLIFSIFGTDLGPALPVNLVVQPDQTLSQSLGGVEVLVNGIPCPLIYVSSRQINAIAPFALYTKNAAYVAVRYLGALSDEVPVSVAPSIPGLFSYPSIGSGPGAILNQDMSVNTQANPALRGSVITLFGGGDGQSSPQGIDGLVNPAQLDQLPRPLLPVTVMIGGVMAADVLYAGAAPTLTSGVIQVNVRIPATLPVGDLPVILQVGATSSHQD